MKIYHGLEQLQQPAYPIVTIGAFDGLHLGHQKILARLKEIALQKNGQTVVITFWPHPRTVLFPEQAQDLRLLTTQDEKIKLLADFGIDVLVVLPFTKAFSQLSSHDFLQDVIVRGIGTKVLVIGYDHHFGRNREGSFEYISKHAAAYGFGVEEIPREDVDDMAISSTKIREALQNGQVGVANHLLGRPYAFQGYVVHGRQLGRNIGFPTANIEIIDPHKLIPAFGVYAVCAEVQGKQHGGMMNVGLRPTVAATEASIEVHLFDFDQNIYGQTMNISVIDFIRSEQKFDSIESLRAQLHHDEKVIRALLLRYTCL